MSQGARTRNFMLRPYDSLLAPREASPAFRLAERTHQRPVISDRAVCIAAVVCAVVALLIVNV
jgi:hypothetical protein